MLPPRAQDILDFWFEQTPESAWWKVDPGFDSQLRLRFLPLLEQAAAGELHAWRDSARGRLAEVIVLDQFPRNLHRGTALSFAPDPMALALSYAPPPAVPAALWGSAGCHGEDAVLLHSGESAGAEGCGTLAEEEGEGEDVDSGGMVGSAAEATWRHKTVDAAGLMLYWIRRQENIVTRQKLAQLALQAPAPAVVLDDFAALKIDAAPATTGAGPVFTTARSAEAVTSVVALSALSPASACRRASLCATQRASASDLPCPSAWAWARCA
jgi:hypothetical protein